MCLTREVLADLQWWIQVLKRWQGWAFLRRLTSASMVTDASDYGWGATLEDPSRPALAQPLVARGFWSTQERTWHINYKELEAIRLGIKCFLQNVSNRTVHLGTDSQTVCCVLEKWRSWATPLHHELRKLWWLLDTHRITIQPQ